MKTINFVKMHGSGNDFLIIDSNDNPDLYIKEECNFTQAEIEHLCHRNFGVGCDQLLLIEKSSHPKAHFNYRIYNQDGSNANHCGNGARCVIAYLINHKNISDPIILNVNNKLIEGKKVGDDLIQITMETPSFNPKDIGYIGTYNPNNKYIFSDNNTTITFSIASIGNPHALIELDDITKLNNDSILKKIAITLQESNQFINGVNVNFFVVNKNIIHLRTFERGCGFTLSCGTGACATASYLIQQNKFDSYVQVKMPGGSVAIEWKPNHSLQMIGPAHLVFKGTIVL